MNNLPKPYPQSISGDEHTFISALRKLINTATENTYSDADLLQVCIQKQNVLNKETMESLLTLSKVYTDVFMLSRQNKKYEAGIALKQANNLVKQFSFTSQERNMFTVLTYPRVSYFYYRAEKYTVAKWYLKVAININNRQLGGIPFFNLFTFQQTNNYAVLHFKTNHTTQGLRLMMQNLRNMLSERSNIENEMALAVLYSLIKDAAGILLRELQRPAILAIFNKQFKNASAFLVSFE